MHSAIASVGLGEQAKALKSAASRHELAKT